MSQLKSLASQTAVYGVSSILGRMLTYALVPLHTAVFDRAEMGVVTYLYGFVALLLVIYTFGMETTFFRFANKGDKQDTINQTATFIIFISTLLTVIILLGASTLAGLADLEFNTELVTIYIQWLAIALWIDAILAIPFALMRLENKARAFATAKIINIFITVGLQLFFLLLVPYLRENGVTWLDWVPDLGIGFIFITNLIANGVLIFILFPWIRRLRITWLNWNTFRPMFMYAAPIMITGLAGMFNEYLDKILLKEILPENFYPNTNPTEAVGVYGQLFKLSIFMMLGIQAFRYAGEPFFFSKAADKKAPELFARVMRYFTLACLTVLVLVTLNVDFIAFIFLRDEVYRVSLYIVPILLGGKLFYGIYMNLSIWFKLTDKTSYGTWFSLFGAAITVIGNLLLIPVLGFEGSAWTALLCYLSMSLICYFYGQKYYPIPYQFQKLIVYFIATLVIVVASIYIHHPDFLFDTILRIIASVLLTGALIYWEWRLIRLNPIK
jgi:O-antigen/teichoic acid export membrane protein